MATRLSFLLFASMLLLVQPLMAQMPPMTVRAVPATVQAIEPHHRFTGSLRAIARGTVAALEDGRILEITVREGATVSQGDVIARIDARRLEAQKAELQAAFHTAEALIAQREAELRQANLDMDRSSTLIRNNAISQQQHERYETEVAVAQARLDTDRRRLEEIRSQLDLVEVRLEDTVVRAPYDAQVVERHAEPGEWIRAGEPFVTLISTGKVEAWLEIPERFAGVLAQYAKSVPVTMVGSDKQFVSLSTKRVHDIHPRTRTFQFVLTLDAGDQVLTPGMSVEAWLPTGPKKESLTVPKDALIRSAGASYVFKAVEAEGQMTAVRSPVSVQFEAGNLAVVESQQLAAGDLVVIEGNERLFPGMPIAVSERPSQNPQTATTVATRPR